MKATEALDAPANIRRVRHKSVMRCPWCGSHDLIRACFVPRVDTCSTCGTVSDGAGVVLPGFVAEVAARASR